MSAAKHGIVRWLAPRLAYAYLRLCRMTMRLEYGNREALDRACEHTGPYILAFWHSRFVMMPYVYPGDRIAVLSSTHADSRLLADVLRRFGFTVAEGSSSRGGAAGLRTMLRLARDGHDLGITPDGPKGPPREAKPGVIAVARMAGIPIVPVSFSARPARRLGSWDRTLLPLPFSRGRYLFGEPIHVPREANREQQEALRLAVQTELDRLTDELDRQLTKEDS
jgi:lysophospholipid acyltransferase (LPLAT)-like uncharacterized protein